MLQGKVNIKSVKHKTSCVYQAYSWTLRVILHHGEAITCVSPALRGRCVILMENVNVRVWTFDKRTNEWDETKQLTAESLARETTSLREIDFTAGHFYVEATEGFDKNVKLLKRKPSRTDQVKEEE